MILDILKGIQFIHSAGIIHRDLKSPNLLVDRSWRIKIADFGLSCVKSQEDDDAQISLLWTAPEILAKQKGCYTEKSDVYSIGIMVWEMLARRTPFDDTIAAAISPAVVAGKRPALNPEWNSALLQFIKRCWAPLPSDRHSVVEARHTIESIDVDPDFEIGGSSTTLDKYVEKAAPPPSGHVTFVFSTVAHSAELWKHDPHSMMRALLLHNEVINDLIAREKGYKVKSNGDSYLISFPVSVQAVSFCLKAQRLLLDVDWPASLLQHPLAAPQRSDEGDVFMRGLSLKMGIHIAQVMVDRDSTTENVDYRGDGMTVAPKLASLAPPGTIFITADMYSNVMASIESLEPFVIESVGTRVFKKGADAVILYQMVPQLLSVRNEVRDYLDQPEIYESNAAGKFEFIEHKDRFAIEYEELEIGAKIGAGSFGEVKAGSLRGRKVAIKQLIRHKVTDVAQIELRAECAVLQSMDHKNVIRFEGMCFKLPNICLVTEFMEKDTISWNIRRRMLLDIAEGMAYLHSKDIIHRDVKSSNMLVAADDTVKIADFGFSRIKAENQTMTQCGTVAWTAPEIFEGNHYTEKADVYSYAIIIWEVINRKKPWEGVHAMRLTANVIAGKRPPPPTQTSSNAPRQHDPRSRPTFQHIITTLLHEVT